MGQQLVTLNGSHKYVYSNGDSYEGNFVNGVRFGNGIYTTFDGHRYDGEWSADQRHGKGEFTFAERFKTNKNNNNNANTNANANQEQPPQTSKDPSPSVTAIMAAITDPSDADLSKVLSINSNDENVSHTIETTENNVEATDNNTNLQTNSNPLTELLPSFLSASTTTSPRPQTYGWAGTYEGNWRLNVCDGHGIFIYVSGDRYDGNWKSGLKHGKGAYIFANSDRYDGEFANGHFEGEGMYTFASGDSIFGMWSKDRQHGPSVVTLRNNRRRKEVWWRGKRISCSESRKKADWGDWGNAIALLRNMKQEWVSIQAEQEVKEKKRQRDEERIKLTDAAELLKSEPEAIALPQMDRPPTPQKLIPNEINIIDTQEPKELTTKPEEVENEQSDKHAELDNSSRSETEDIETEQPETVKSEIDDASTEEPAPRNLLDDFLSQIADE